MTSIIIILQCIILLRNRGSWHSCGCNSPKLLQSTTPHVNSTMDGSNIRPCPYAHRYLLKQSFGMRFRLPYTALKLSLGSCQGEDIQKRCFQFSHLDRQKQTFGKSDTDIHSSVFVLSLANVNLGYVL